MPEPPRFAVYGSLAPGRPNHYQLSELQGKWFTGHVRGRLMAEGWGAAMGFPAAWCWTRRPARSPCRVFESVDLPDHWQRLDAFEGDGYRSAAALIRTAEGNLLAGIYVLARPAVPDGWGRLPK